MCSITDYICVNCGCETVLRVLPIVRRYEILLSIVVVYETLYTSFSLSWLQAWDKIVTDESIIISIVHTIAMFPLQCTTKTVVWCCRRRMVTNGSRRQQRYKCTRSAKRKEPCTCKRSHLMEHYFLSSERSSEERWRWRRHMVPGRCHPPAYLGIDGKASSTKFGIGNQLQLGKREGGK